MDELNFNSVETIPGLNASAAFHVDSGKVFKEDTDIVPSLDLVLTPNGFGIVSNQNVAPASRDRVARLIASLEKSCKPNSKPSSLELC